MGLDALEVVAHAAGEPEIGLVVRSAARDREQVIHLERPQHEVPGAQAVTTAVARLGADPSRTSLEIVELKERGASADLGGQPPPAPAP